MKFFLLVCLAAAVYAEPEADPWLLYGQQQPVVYNNLAVKPAVYNQWAYQPSVYNWAQPAVYSHVVPAVQEATIHQTKGLVGPGGSVAPKTAVAGQHSAYTVYHGMNKDKRSAESDPAVVLNAGVLPYQYGYATPQYYSSGVVAPQAYSAGVVAPQYYSGLSGLYNTYNTQATYVNGVRIAKREADSEADPALLYRSAYAGVPVVNNAWGYSAPAVSSYVNSPYVSSPYVYSNRYATAWNGWY